MKLYQKFAIAVVAILCVAGTANAGGFRFGIKAGLNVNSLHFNEKTFDSNNRAGFTAGVMTEFTVPIIGIGVDLSAMYTRMNSSYDVNSLVIITEKYGRNFIEIPLNLKYKLTLPAIERIVKPYIFTGPTFAFQLDKKIMHSFQTKTCQVAWNIGLGVELINHLQVGASYGFGINNIAKNLVNTADLKVKNNYWTITAAYLF